MCKYYKVLDDYKKGIILLPDHKLFEYVAAIKLNMIMWEDILNIPEARLNTQYSVSDSGIDIISYNLTVAGQVKYGDRVTWSMLNTFEGLCNHLEQVSKRIVVVRHDAKLSNRVKTICKIIRINMAEELNYTPMMINKQLNYSGLSIGGKIQELIAFGHKPKTNTKFSDGQNMYSFWYPIIRYRKLNLATYTKLRETPWIMSLFTEDEDDFQLQVNSLLKYVDDYVDIMKLDNIDHKLCDKFIIWRECKLYRKCEQEPWSQLLSNDMFKQDYYEHLKSIDLDAYNLAIGVDKIVECIERGIDISGHDIWINCVNNDLRDEWPYTLIFEYETFDESYTLLTTNFPHSTYDDIYEEFIEDTLGIFVM
jgi:hypothetical protein